MRIWKYLVNSIIVFVEMFSEIFIISLVLNSKLVSRVEDGYVGVGRVV